MNITEIFEDSPNGYEIRAGQPKNDVDEAIRYYLTIMDQYSIEELPVEFGITNYSLGILLFSDRSEKGLQSEERARRVENALYHFNQALQVFTHKDYPSMFSIISIMMGRLFKERAALISHRSFLANRSSPEDSIQYGLDQVLDALPILSLSRSCTIENALCNLEAGWLYVLQSEFLDNCKDSVLREQGITYLERAIALAQSISNRSKTSKPSTKTSESYSDVGNDIVDFPVPGDASRRWNPLKDDPGTFPSHIQLLFEGFSFNYIEATATYLLGRLYQGWVPTPSMIDLMSAESGSTRQRKAASLSAEEEKKQLQDLELSYQEKAFEYLCASVRPKLLQKKNPLWGDAHHRAALVLARYPRVVNPEYVDPATLLAEKKIKQQQQVSHTSATVAAEEEGNSSDLHLEMAASHFSLALRCESLTKPERMNLHFHFAQSLIARLQMTIDAVPVGQSVTRTLGAHSDGLDTIKNIEENLQQAIQRVTPASTQTTQDAYLYYFSCLKISEYRMLEAACRPELQAVEREDFLRDAVEYLIDALLARTLSDNLDLHYICTLQMSQLLLAVKRYYAASKAYAKCLFTLSVMTNRSLFNPEIVQGKLNSEIARQVGQALLAGARDVAWVKLHFGPVSLNERVTAGYASWEFEEATSVKKRRTMLHQSSVSSIDSQFPLGVEDSSKYKPLQGAGAIGIAGLQQQQQPLLNRQEEDAASSVGGHSSMIASSVLPAYKASPPKGVPPLNLPAIKSKKVFVSGEQMPDVKPPMQLLHNKSNMTISEAGRDGVLLMKKKPLPPTGPVPLFALGHNPKYGTGDRSSAAAGGVGAVGILLWDSGNNSDGDNSGSASHLLLGQGGTYQYFAGPYGRRMRRRIPPMKEMSAIDSTNLANYGLRKGKTAFLLPRHIRRTDGGSTAQVKTIGASAVPNSRKSKQPTDPSSQGGNTGNKLRSDASVVSHRIRQGSDRQESVGGGSGSDSDSSKSEAGGVKSRDVHGSGDDDPSDDLNDEDVRLVSPQHGKHDDLSVAISAAGDGSEAADEAKSATGNKGKVMTRSRSQRVTAADIKMKKRGAASPDVAAVGKEETKHSQSHRKDKQRANMSQQNGKNHLSAHQQFPEPIKKETTLSWFLSGFSGGDAKKMKKTAQKAKQLEIKTQKKNRQPPTRSFLNPFGRPSSAGDSAAGASGTSSAGLTVDGGDVGTLTLSVAEGGGMWASTQCFFSFMMLSRQARMQLVLRSSRLGVLDGERTSYCMYRLKPKYLNTYYTLRKMLTKDCAELVVPPLSLKDLSQKPFQELQVLFNSQSKIDRRLDDLENLLYYKISKIDNFLPFVTTVPVYLRDLKSYDDALLNGERLLLNLENESALQQFQSRKLKEDSAKAANTSPPPSAAASIAVEMNSRSKVDGLSGIGVGSGVGKGFGSFSFGNWKKKKYDYDSVSGASSGSVASLQLPDGSADIAAKKKVLDKQEREEREEVAVGKMTLSLSQSLDGSNYLRDRQQGSRDMLVKCLKADECLLIWHLPAVPTQPLQVVLVWRGQSASLYADLSASRGKKHMHETLEQVQQQRKQQQPRPGTAASSTKRGANSQQQEEESEKLQQLGIVMEVAKSDLDASHMMQYIQGFLEALHLSSAPARESAVTDALRALSCALSLTEFLHMIPPHVKSLVICCPPPMRLIPWHLLLIEPPSHQPFFSSQQDAGNSATAAAKVNEIHLLEKFCVRLGPTLALFELNAEGGATLRHSVGLHRLVAVDGEADHPDRSPGVRGTDLEVACVSHTWSADPNDSHILQNESAVPRALQTGLFGTNSIANNDDFVKFKKDVFIRRREKIDHIKLPVETDDFNSTLNKKISTAAAIAETGAEKSTSGARVSFAASAVAESDDEADDSSSDEEKKRVKKEARQQQKASRAAAADAKALTMCRVLHIAARKVSLDVIAKQFERERQSQDNANFQANGENSIQAAIELPQFDRLMTFRNPNMLELVKSHKRSAADQNDDNRNTLSAADIVRQLYVKNCALCVLSKFGLTDDVSSIRSPENCDCNCEFIEALHLAGAKAVMYPLWSSVRHSGLMTLAHVVFLVRFYATLPQHSKNPHSTVETCRRTQSWLRSATANDVIAFVHKAPIPSKARSLIIEEMESYVAASLTGFQQMQKKQAKQKLEETSMLASPGGTIIPSSVDDRQHQHLRVQDDASITTHGLSVSGPSFILPASTTGAGELLDKINPGDRSIDASASPAIAKLGNRVGGEHKFFGHVLYWGAFAVSGIGGNVHHPDLTEDKDEGFEGHIPWDDEELNNMEFEASVLRMEGKIEDAKELEQLIRELKIRRLKERVAQARATGARAGRGILDTLDYLDKKFLDQDSDEISVSDDSAEVRRRRRQKDRNRPRESDSDEYDDADDISVPDQSRAGPATKKSAGAIKSDTLSPSTAAHTEQLLRSPSKRFEPVPLNLGSMKAENIGYDKWKSKVGGLDMAVKSPVLAKHRSARGGALTPAKGKASNTDNFEYNMMKKVKNGEQPVEEEEEDYDAKMEALYKKKELAKQRQQEKASKKKVGDSSGSDESDASKADKSAGKRTQQRRAGEDYGSDSESDDDDDSDGDGLYSTRKKLRKKKEKLRKRKRQKTRFSKAMKEVKGGVRSYSTAVKQLASDIPTVELRSLLKRKKAAASKQGANSDGDADAVAVSDEEKCVIN